MSVVLLGRSGTKQIGRSGTKAHICLALLAGNISAIGCISTTCTSSMERAEPKRQRIILDLRGNHHVSQRVLAQICHGENNNIVQATSQRIMLRSRTAFANRDTTFGEIIQERRIKLRKVGCISLTILPPSCNAMGLLRRLS